jgi:hypothetical protein
MRFVFRLHEYYRSLERQNCRASLGYWTIGSNEYPTLITRISQEIIKIRKMLFITKKDLQHGEQLVVRGADVWTLNGILGCK